jgi:hypothetical protein
MGLKRAFNHLFPNQNSLVKDSHLDGPGAEINPYLHATLALDLFEECLDPGLELANIFRRIVGFDRHEWNPFFLTRFA